MKRTGILHPELARVVASMGHGDLLCVADAGFPIPAGVRRVDLAFGPGQPGLGAVLEVILGELEVEGIVVARQAKEGSAASLVSRVSELVPGVEIDWVDHEDLKHLSNGARAVVRTGEYTPYANLILRAGVAF